MSSDEKTSPSTPSRGLVEEFLSVWRQLPDRAALLCLFAAWVALFHFLGNSTLGYVNTRSLFGWWVWVETRGTADAEGRVQISKILDSDEAHAWIMPFVVLGLLWWRREELLALPKRVCWPAALLVLGGLLLHVVGYMIQQARLSVVGFVVGLYGITGLLWGLAWLRAALFPFSLLFFCVPMGAAAEPVTFPLRLLATKLTGIVCQAVLGINVDQKGTQLFNPSGTYQYEVAAACGGIRSLTAILAFGVIYSFLAHKSLWRRALIVAAAFPLAVLGNVFRLTLIVVSAEAFGREAGNFVHENFFFSLAPYVPAMGGMLLLGWWISEDRKPGKKAEPVLLTGEEQKA